MAGKFMRIKSMVIPIISLVILMSQVLGCAAVSRDDLLEEIERGNEVVIEYSEMNTESQQAVQTMEREQVTYLSAGQSTAQTYTATPSSDKTTLNGSPVTMQAYKINGNNYIKLRDFANMVNGTPLNFEVEWDGSLNAINMYTGKPYTVVGGEGAPIGPETKQATDTTSTIYVNGSVANLKGYFIGGNNYFKLRDLGSALGIGIDWDSTTKTVVVDSTGTNGGAGGSGESGSVGGSGETSPQKPTNSEGTYELSPELEAKLQERLDRIGRDDPFAKRVEAGWRTTLSPEDPRHPGWDEGEPGNFFVAALRPGEKQPENAKSYDAYCAYGSWDGITVN